MQPMNDQNSSRQKTDFEQLPDEQQMSIVREFVYFIVHNKKWWMIPIVFVLLVLGLLVALGSTGAAPFIYTLF